MKDGAKYPHKESLGIGSEDSFSVCDRVELLKRVYDSKSNINNQSTLMEIRHVGLGQPRGQG